MQSGKRETNRTYWKNPTLQVKGVSKKTPSSQPQHLRALPHRESSWPDSGFRSSKRPGRGGKQSLLLLEE